MESLLDAIRIAASDGASDDERRRGLLACRAVAFALDGGIVVDAPPPISSPAVEPVGADTASRPDALPVVASPLVSNPFAGLTADQILDLAIAKLRGALGENGDDATPPSPAGQPFRLTLVPLPPRFS
jgi:hypothetical protein